MRIAFLGPSYPWRGGIAKFAQNLGEKCRELGNDVMMFTFIHQYPALLFPGSDQYDISLHPSHLPTQHVLTPYNPYTWFSTIHELKNWKPDVVIVSYWLPFMAPAFGFILKRLHNIKKIYLLHNIDFHEKWLYSSKLTRYALKPADKYITLSDVTATALSRILKLPDRSNIIKLYHPVYEHFNFHGHDHNSLKYRILFFGFVKHYKGLDILIEAMPLIVKKYPELKLIVAGDVYGDKKPYLDQIERLKLGNNVELHLEYIPDEQIEDYFTGSDLCIIPYRSATQSGVVQMSFAFEIPVIATRVGGIEETVIDGKNGFLVERENPHDLADKILKFYSQDFAEQFKAVIKDQNTRFSWDNFTKQILESAE